MENGTVNPPPRVAAVARMVGQATVELGREFAALAYFLTVTLPMTVAGYLLAAATWTFHDLPKAAAGYWQGRREQRREGALVDHLSALGIDLEQWAAIQWHSRCKGEWHKHRAAISRIALVDIGPMPAEWPAYRYAEDKGLPVEAVAAAREIADMIAASGAQPDPRNGKSMAEAIADAKAAIAGNVLKPVPVATAAAIPLTSLVAAAKVEADTFAAMGHQPAAIVQLPEAITGCGHEPVTAAAYAFACEPAEATARALRRAAKEALAASVHGKGPLTDALIAAREVTRPWVPQTGLHKGSK